MSIRVSGVTLRYLDAPAPALDNVDLAIDAGAITWLHGAPGAGSSSLLLALAGHAPRFTGGTIAGTISVLDSDPQSEEGRARLRGRLAYVTAVPALQLSGVGATVWEEVAFAPANLGWPLERIDTSVARALDRLGIAHLRERDPAHLSGGELQRVIVASVAVLDPELWLLDRPATALDAEGRRRVLDLLREEAARGAAVVIASEDTEEMAAVADRLVVLAGGRVALDGPPRSLLEGDALWDVGAAGTAWAALARRAHARIPSPRLEPPYPLELDAALARWS